MTWLKTNWRAILARAPLPLLALAASWGVYSFAALYVPQWVAIVQASAFEATYIGLAVTRDLSQEQRKRATAISVGAVAVSVCYNSIDGLFARNPAWLVGLPWGYEIAGAILHGAPLAIVAYLVADLLLHSDTAPAQTTPTARVLAPIVTVGEVTATPPESAPLSKTALVKRLALARGESESTIWRKVKAGELSLNGKDSH